MPGPTLIRRIAGSFFVLLSLFLWTVSSDLIELIARQEEILFGLYSRQRFGQIFILNLILLGFAYLLFSDMKFGRAMVYKVIAVLTSTFVGIFTVILGSQWLLAPRYVEESVTQTKNGVQLQGMVRYRRPNQFYELIFKDEPLTHRSYPSAPDGHGPVEIELTIDRYGYRNKDLQENYDIVVVGDSFTTGSNVSDSQMWSVLLSQRLGQSIYNLGASGSDPQVYLNNFVQLGLKFNPKTVIFMIYEGNDFRTKAARLAAEDISLGDKISTMTKNSPVTAGLRRLSSEVIEAINADATVPGYQEKLGWMPVQIGTGSGADYYGFKPKRLGYLYGSEDEFRQSREWQFAKGIFEEMEQVARDEGFRLLVVYAPSKPHVIFPLVEENVSAEQIRSFVAYRKKSLPPAKEFKAKLVAELGSQEYVLRDFCEQAGIEFVSATRLLQQMSSAGEQTYYTYDQHWTPAGNELVASMIGNYLKP
ncbi:MAG: SGNH/GDSL hydrolase family protein [bacterium]|nr:hypothetical protein [Gammaproteobacteria bacterium]HIL99273.1 hypothetical protein [Pseudomonadales bacterium]